MTIEKRPATLLANLLDDVGTDSAQPLFVDANPDRFAYILDWYRFGEIHLSDGVPTKAILQDARFFLLPDSIKINGSSHTLDYAAVESMNDALTAAIIRDWPTFDEYIAKLIAEVRQGCEAVGNWAKNPVRWWSEYSDIPEQNIHFHSISLARGESWDDQANVCSMPRFNVLIAELEKRGFHCKATVMGDYPEMWLVLRVGVGKVDRVQPVRINGVDAVAGKLQVNSHKPPW